MSNCLEKNGFQKDAFKVSSGENEILAKLDFINEEMNKLTNQLNEITGKTSTYSPIKTPDISHLDEKYTKENKVTEYNIPDAKKVSEFGSNPILSKELQAKENPFENPVYFKPVYGDVGLYYSNPNETFEHGNIQEESKFLLDNKPALSNRNRTEEENIKYYAEAISKLPCS